MSSLKDYPEGRGAQVTRYIKDVLVTFGVVQTLRQRFTVAQLTTVGTIFTGLPALPGVRWRLIDAMLIAIGGNVTTSTSINIAGVVAGSAVELVVVAIAALTRSTFVRAGATNAVVLADGASLTQMDANTAITAHSVGGTPTVATAVDMIVDYVADPA
jgi:hypothetical protein